MTMNTENEYIDDEAAFPRASNFGEMSREARNAIVAEASGYSRALEEALFKGKSVYRNCEITCHRDEEFVNFEINEISMEKEYNSEERRGHRMVPVIGCRSPGLDTISSKEFEYIEKRTREHLIRYVCRFLKK